MGKAGRWIRNLLVGKKEDKVNTKDGGGSPPITTAATPRRRWSFRRSNNTEKVAVNHHKSCRSFDSIINSQLVSQALFDYAILQQNTTTVLAVPPREAAIEKRHSVFAAAAATKIQSAFRSYLARKALCALRGLVKLQALVRGHLVRKRTTTMVRCMRALVSIQVRARFQRIQMAEDKDSRCATSTKLRGCQTMAHKRRLSAPQFDHNENLGRFDGKTSSSRNYGEPSRRFSVDSSPLSTHQKSMRSHNKPMEDVSRTSRQHEEPNYMTRTKSSRAKARSQSEPRQRPTKQKRENSRSDGLTNVVRKHEDWLMKLYGASNWINDCEFNSSYYTDEINAELVY